jgi:hypothetical protein
MHIEASGLYMFSSLSMFFQQPQQRLAPLAQGDTPLHTAVRNCKNANEIELFLKKTGSVAASVMARTVNDEGQLPIDLVFKNTTLKADVKQEISSLMTPYLKTNSLKKLSDLIDSKEVLNSYHFSPDSEIYRNIQTACSVVNESRKTIKESATHPQVNTWSGDEKNALNNKINKMREGHICDQVTFILTNPIGLLLDTQHTIYEKLAELPLKNGIGNCSEFALTAWHFLKKQDRNIAADIYSIKNGDHVFLVIGEGNNAVVCDAWAGEVYPVNEIPKRLGCFGYYQTADSSYINVIKSYNPRFHTAMPDPGLKVANRNYKLLIFLGMFAVFKVYSAMIANIESDSPDLLNYKSM